MDAQVFILGYYGTGTSLVTRLLMLMGAYAGQLEEVHLSQVNRLLYNERWDVAEANAQLLGAYYKAMGKVPVVAKSQGFDWEAAEKQPQLQEAVADFRSKVRAIMSSLTQYPVSVMTDSRLPFSAKLWLAEATAPVCVLPFRHPYKVALKMLADPKRGRMGGWQPE